MKWTLILLFLALYNYTYSQNDSLEIITIEYGDLAFMKKDTVNPTEYISSYERYRMKNGYIIKDNLPKGRYIVLYKDDCLTDTIIDCTFSDVGVKSGVWKFWDIPSCMTYISIDNTYEIVPNESAYIDKIIHYQNGEIFSETYYDFHGSFKWYQTWNVKNKPTLKNGEEWIASKTWYTDDKIKFKKSIQKNANQEVEVFKHFNLFGQLSFEEIKNDSFRINKSFYHSGETLVTEIYSLINENLPVEIKYYYENGEIKAYGKIENNWKKNVVLEEKDADWHQKEGHWRYYDAQGVEIGFITYDNGEIIDKEIMPNKKISFN